MIRYHPNINTLAEYAAGALDTAPAIAVSAHLHFCHHCRKQVDALQTLGGQLMEVADTAEVDPAVLESLLQKLDEPAAPAREKPASTDPELRELPPVIAHLIGSRSRLHWKKLTKCLQIAPLRTGQARAEVSLHKISAGGKVLEHDHRGPEYTLVLKGSFSDENGVYQPGDFLLKQPGDVHRPYAAANRDCLCLTVVEAPVRFTGFWGWLLNPFLRLNPA